MIVLLKSFFQQVFDRSKRGMKAVDGVIIRELSRIMGISKSVIDRI